LQALSFPSAAERLAWLADHLTELPGSGIVYALTVRDSERVARWLKQRGIAAEAYHAAVELPHLKDVHESREYLEQALLANRVKCLVATTALSMGFDKPDLGFVIHYQAPGSVIFYYQQVGRAGRAIPEAYGVLLSGQEDDDINEFFRETAFPPDWQVDRILEALSSAENGLTLPELETNVNLRRGQVEKVLKILAVQDEAPVTRGGSKWFRTPNPYQKDVDRMERLRQQRTGEWAQMKDYMTGAICHMEFLSRALDDPAAAACGKCEVCEGAPAIPATYREGTLIDAQRFLRHSEMELEPRLQWPKGRAFIEHGWTGTIRPEVRLEVGRFLARWGEAGWGRMVREGKESGAFSDALVAGAAEMIRERWKPRVKWVTCVPSLRHPGLVPQFAQRLAEELGLPFAPVVRKIKETDPQKHMQNSFHQCRNLDGAFAIRPAGVDVDGPVLLVDDVADSRWTLTVIAALLREAGSGPVFPLALANTAAG
jgi:ATP-dependent DNA helicase RecQ